MGASSQLQPRLFSPCTHRMKTWERFQYQPQHFDEDEIICPSWELNHNSPACDVISTITKLSDLGFIMLNISEQDIRVQPSLLVHCEGPYGAEEWDSAWKMTWHFILCRVYTNSTHFCRVNFPSDKATDMQGVCIYCMGRGEILQKLRQTTINKLDGVSKRGDRRQFIWSTYDI